MQRKRLFSLLSAVLILLICSTLVYAEYRLSDLNGYEFFMSTDAQLENWVNDPKNRSHIQTLEEKYNFTFNAEFIDPHGGMNSAVVKRMIQDILEGNLQTDLYLVGSTEIPGLVREGLIQPLDEAIAVTEYFENLPDVYRNWNFFQHKGKTWAVDRAPLARKVIGIIWNKDLFAREGLPSLYELYENGEWTWEAFRDIAIRATRDTDGDGEIDQWGVATFDNYANSARLMIQWAFTNGITPTTNIDGREVFSYDHPAAVEAFEFWADLMNQGVVQMQQQALFSRGQAAMLNYWVWMSGDSWTGIPTMEDDWGVVPLPKGPRMDKHVAPMTNAWVMVAPITNPDPALSLEIFAAAMQRSKKYVDVNRLHDEMIYEKYSVNHRDRETDEHMRWLMRNAEFIPYMDIIFEAGFVESLTGIFSGERTAASAMGTLQPVVQSLIDDIFDQ